MIKTKGNVNYNRKTKLLCSHNAFETWDTCLHRADITLPYVKLSVSLKITWVEASLWGKPTGPCADCTLILYSWLDRRSKKWNWFKTDNNTLVFWCRVSMSELLFLCEEFTQFIILQKSFRKLLLQRAQMS